MPVAIAGWAAVPVAASTAHTNTLHATRPHADIAVVYRPVYRSRLGVTRREFLTATAAGLALSPALRAQARALGTLPNGIVLPQPWPPVRGAWTGTPERPPYLSAPPAVIGIDHGRQLFVDDFLIQESSLYRAFHRAEYHAGGPVLQPERPWERRDPHAELAGYQPSPSAMVFSDGVFYDPADRVFKLWYMAGYQSATALATSTDGIRWDRPAFDVVRGTNIVSATRRDSNTVWLDLEAPDRQSRFVMAAYDLEQKALRFSTSADGIHWREVGVSGPCGDRSTFFRNPIRRVWAYSLRHDLALVNRTRRYAESAAFPPPPWTADGPVSWIGADSLDPQLPNMPTTKAELYNLDAVAYESVFVGLFSLFRGERLDREKPNDLCVAFSRDGFHWSRLWREPFIGVSDTPGDWNYSNVQSAGGGCLIVGDRLHFYVSGRQGIPGTSLPGVCSTGLATLRRDGFASLTDQWPAGMARTIAGPPGTLTTRPVRFSGSHGFVNADVAGDLRVAVLDADGRAIKGFTLADAAPITGNGTRLPMSWAGGASLASLAGRTVRFRFALEQARLFAFWVSRSAGGQSGGAVAAGGPAFRSTFDTP